MSHLEELTSAQTPRADNDRESQAANDDRRQPNSVARTTKAEFLQRLKQEYFFDILRARYHSKHFRHTRANTLSNRVRTLALLLGILIPAWSAVDALYLNGTDLQVMLLLRFTTGISLLGLAAWRGKGHNLNHSRIKLSLLVLIPSLFQTLAHLYLAQSSYHGLPPGYHFFPFIIISLAAIFPLTIFEGAILASFVSGLYLLTAAYLSKLLTIQTLNDIWLLVLLSLVTGFAALTQLQMMMRLYRQAHRDPLTGLANRRSIVSYLQREVEQSREHHLPLSLMLLDLDKFKRINDTFGHAAGDEVLKSFARLLVQQSRAEDLVGRYGGEEFLMILSGTPREGAQIIAERLRAACHEEIVPDPSGKDLRYTTSIGVTELHENETIESMLKRVDDALYEAKGGGRDRVVIA